MSPLRSLLPMLLLAACSPPSTERPPANQSESASPRQEPAPPVPSLTGQWRVTGLNNGPVRQAYAMGATFDGSRLTIRSDCVNIAWSYTQDRNTVSFKPAPADSCARGLTLDEFTARKAIGGANIAIFSDEGRQVQFTGSGGAIAMTRR